MFYPLGKNSEKPYGGRGGRRNMKGDSVGNIKRCEAGEIGGGIEIIKGFRHAVKEKGVSLGAYQGFWRMPEIQGTVGGTSIQNVQIY